MTVGSRESLYRWYRRSRRSLPWRDSSDPYEVWVSEVMLQQTRVEQVVPYYLRFLERFPTVEALAVATEEEVRALWSGLGYYRRARQLHAAARRVVAAGGRLPESVDGLLALPGIGPYTAAAVASIAFGVCEPVVDGNVERVVARYLALEEEPRRAAGRRRIVAAARELLDPDRPGEGNQALMELGAQVCTPIAPACPRCPLLGGCEAARRGEAERFPRRRRQRRREGRRWRMVVVERGERVLLFRRPEGSTWLPGSWELPWIDDPPPADDPAAALARRYGGRWRVEEEVVGDFRHAITYRRIEVRLQRREVA